MRIRINNMGEMYYYYYDIITIIIVVIRVEIVSAKESISLLLAHRHDIEYYV